MSNQGWTGAFPRRLARSLASVPFVFFAFALGENASSVAAPPVQLPSASSVIQLFQKDALNPEGTQSPAGRLLAEIERYRRDSRTMSPARAASTWFGLYDSAVKIGGPAIGEDAELDIDTRGAVGIASVLAALPPPEVWPALRDEALHRVQENPDRYQDRVLALLAQELLGDRAAVTASLNSLDSAIKLLPPKSRMIPIYYLEQTRLADTNLHGDAKDIADGVLRAVSKSTLSSLLGSDMRPAVKIPDLVTLVGAERAEDILTAALTSTATVQVVSGDATRALARAVALKHLADLKKPQWLLIDSIDAADLYEALRNRFVHEEKRTSSNDASPDEGDSGRREADTYYFLSLVTRGRQSDAEKALEGVAANHSIFIPRQALDALERAHQNDALYSFLGGFLTHHPEMQAWSVYIEQAAYTGHAREALATLDTVLARKDLPNYLRSDLNLDRIRALLSLDQTKPAIAALEELVKAPPKADERGLVERTEAAVQLAGLGRVLNDPRASEAGLAFAESALAAAPHKFPDDSFSRPGIQRAVIAELRKEGKDTHAHQLITTELARSMNEGGTEKQLESLGMTGAPSTRRVLLGELVGLYAAAHQFDDVQALLTDVEHWGARDVRELLNDKDALDIPVALSAARALAALGDRDSARRVTEAVIHKYPGYDGAYELYTTLEANSIPFLETQFKQDQFEERPLIWKATVLARAKQWPDAEKAVREAISIDPSDGEEGPNDRMRAYAVLADILAAKGDQKGAGEYREAVTAIRLSEKTDELHSLGLYQRAFAGYAAALQHFSDAYCIQSRLAVQLNRQGHHEEAAQHYRRAYELMPSSFGRVESHCFGCESVFQGPGPQGIAGEVFIDLEKKEPQNPRVHYLLGYLFEEQGRYSDALVRFREAVQIDGSYLNAWKHLAGLNEHIYVNATDNEVSTLKLMELDPRQRHTTYEVSKVGDFGQLWSVAARLRDTSAASGSISLFALKRSAAVYDESQAKLPTELRAQLQKYQAMMNNVEDYDHPSTPEAFLARHVLIKSIGSLLGATRALGD
jgi:tetratricopeptide (TPR) repeat protein